MNDRQDEFLQSLMATFRGEAVDHLQAITAGLLDLARKLHPEQHAAHIESMFRESHSLKGAARAVGLEQIEALCQALESVFAEWKKRTERPPTPAALELMHRAVDMIQQLVTTPGSIPSETSAAMVESLGDVSSGPPPSSGSETIRIKPSAMPAPPSRERVAGTETIRIATEKLDALLLQAEEMLSIKIAAMQRVDDVRALWNQFNQWNREWSHIQHHWQTLTPGADTAKRVEQLEDFAHSIKLMESHLLALSSAAEHDSVTIGRMVGELLDESKRLLMLPFATFLNVLPKIVHDLCRDQAKQAELVIKGGEIEIDKRILEELKDPLIHLVRNAIDHGIEIPGDRIRQGKAAQATITIAVEQIESNKVSITISDDGAGIDLSHLKQAAVSHGILSEDAARQMGDSSALSLMFLSGISTTPMVTTVSGRGLGLAIVLDKAEKLGGRVSVHTHLGKYTTFQIQVPLIMATFRGILLQSGGQTFVIPTAAVERVGRMRTTDIKTVESRETIMVDNQTVALVRMADVLELQPAHQEQADRLHYVIIKVGDKRMAFSVDAVLHEQEVLVKPLGQPLLRVRNITGATVLGSGKTVLILNPTDLIHFAPGVASSVGPRVDTAPRELTPRKSVLIVEDSITSRMLLKNILESAGYRVKTAFDGMDAMTILKMEAFDGVVSDVDMPRLNGFHLTEKIRNDPHLSTLPVILVTALGTPADREKGVEAGANAYIVKSRFDQSDLLDAVRRLV